jgi:hypothetical protein
MDKNKKGVTVFKTLIYLQKLLKGASKNSIFKACD